MFIVDYRFTINRIVTFIMYVEVLIKKSEIKIISTALYVYTTYEYHTNTTYLIILYLIFLDILNLNDKYIAMRIKLILFIMHLKYR